MGPFAEAGRGAKVLQVRELVLEEDSRCGRSRIFVVEEEHVLIFHDVGPDAEAGEEVLQVREAAVFRELSR